MIGAEFLVQGIGGVIVETEAYGSDDPASHSFKGQNVRNSAMYGSPGSVYVYRSYGLHWCLNFVCLRGSAVLLRAIEPKAGIALMMSRRNIENPLLLCSGPGRLCQALAVDDRLNEQSLAHSPFHLTLPKEPASLSVGTRIGISKAIDLPWRFGLKGSPFLSKRF
ncbi:DNA-3-methyladenine glycosylase [Rhizobium sp. 32-5/1]|uniref:DNA-3-methyladenine glycosylase n=1 Tax=Rhizobium sp. 32-5/1 TaxID=3019602 RepID=UPI00240E515A|nr:DNA-3-methyladenine glycosylase [Rhizobium sp. 32-5/1]WEZ82110.1 DNA-3-methyladenine glycosylase [Rhizobium sp. 32-5/1]